MRRHIPTVLLLLVLFPVAAAAAEQGPAVLSFRSGVPADLLGKTLGLAAAFFPLAIVIALVVEAFGGSPVEPKNYGGIVMRAFVVLALLAVYRPLFGTVVSTASGVAERLAPKNLIQTFATANIQSINALTKVVDEESEAMAAPERDASTSSKLVELFGGLISAQRLVVGYAGGAIFDGLILVLILIGQAIRWAFTQLTQVLLALLYVLGPLALVWHVVGAAGTASRWFRSFVTVAMWPVLSSVLMAISAGLLVSTDKHAVFGNYASAFGGLASTFFMVAMTLIVPSLASALVGGSIKNAPMAAAALAGFAASSGARMAGATQDSLGSTANRFLGDAAKSAGGGSPQGPGGGGLVTVPPSSGASSVSRGGASAGGMSVGDEGPYEPSTADLASDYFQSNPPEPWDPSVGDLGRGGSSGVAADLQWLGVGSAAGAAPSPAAAGFANGLPSAVTVPPPAEVIEKTNPGGRGLQKGAGTFAGAHKLPAVPVSGMEPRGGLEGPAVFGSPLVSAPRQFNAADWDDVG